MTRPTDQEADAKAEAALQLRIQGKTYRAINRELGFASSSAAYKAVTRLLQSTTPEPTEEMRTLEIHRLDDLLDRLYLLLTDKEKPAEQPLFIMDRMLKIQAQRAQLLGLNRPVIVEDELGDQFAALVKRLAQRRQSTDEQDSDDAELPPND